MEKEKVISLLDYIKSLHETTDWSFKITKLRKDCMYVEAVVRNKYNGLGFVKTELFSENYQAMSIYNRIIPVN